MGKIQFIDKLRLSVAVSVAKTVTFGVRSLRLGAASVLPGSIGRRIEPKIVAITKSASQKRSDFGRWYQWENYHVATFKGHT